MAKQRVMVVGGGLAGLSAAMRLAELGIDVDLMSLTPVKRSHSVCAQGGINSVNALTRQQGDTEWLHFDDTVYGGDFLNHQPPVKEMAYWGPRIIDLMDRLGVPFNRTPEGFRDQRRFGGTLYKRTAFAGATTGQQLLYALDEQVRRWETAGKITKYEFWDFLAPVLDDNGVCRGCVGQDLVTMEIRAFPADALVIASGGCGLIFGRSTMSMACTGSAVSRAFQAGAKYGNPEFIQVHPTAVPGADKLRLMSESARGEGGRVWVPRTPHDPRDPKSIPETQRYYFLEERYPEYGNLVPRDIATREIFNVCTHEGLSVDPDRLCVYLDLTHLPRATLDLKLGGILEIYEKFTGVDPRTAPMKIFPAVHYSMGGLWVDYQRSADGGLQLGHPRNQQTSIPGMYAIGECDYQYHGANRLGANSLLSCIFSGLMVAPSIESRLKSQQGAAAERPAALFQSAVGRQQAEHDALLRNSAAGIGASATAGGRGGENPYRIHEELGQVMTRSATVVLYNKTLQEAIEVVHRLQDRLRRCSLSDTGNWTNQNVVFTKALRDMMPVAKAILRGALQRDECRGAHFKPDFMMPGIESSNPADERRQAEAWCDRFEANTRKWLKSTIAVLDSDGEPQLTYEEVDTSLIPPRPRLYGLVGGEMIVKTWKERQASKQPSTNGARQPPRPPKSQQTNQKPVSPVARTAPRLRSFARPPCKSDPDNSAPYPPPPAPMNDSPSHAVADHPAHGPAAARQHFKVRVLRQDAPGEPSYWERHQVVYERDMNVISVLQRIAAQATTIDGTHVAPVAWDCNCLEEVCGACTMVINGRARQACSALVDRLLEDNAEQIELRPMQKFPVIRDLVVDRERLFRALEKLRCWIPVDGYYDLGPGAQISQGAQQERYPLSECMSCGCCLDACPQYTKIELERQDGETEEHFAARRQAIYDRNFVGAHAISQVMLFNAHPVGKMDGGERMDALMAEGGIQVCGNAQNCVQVCPKRIPLTRSIARAGRAATVRIFQRLFDR